MKLSIFLICSYLMGASLSYGQDKPPCDPGPIISEEHAICYGKYYARVISEISEYGYEYYADPEGENWRVRIEEKNPKKTTWIIVIRSNDGSLIEKRTSIKL
ncbi:MAG: hypothetical protein P8017_09195 [Deltaproteobacteria bacterium]